MNRKLDTRMVFPSLDDCHTTGSRAQALVAVVTGDPNEEPRESINLAQWKLVNPLADWVRVDMRGAPLSSDGAWLRQQLSELTDRRHMQSGQLVLLGWRNAGRIALNLVLNGALTCAGIVGVDIPCAAPQGAIAPMTAGIRLVLHEGEVSRTDGGNLTHALRREHADTRIMMLPSVGFDVAEATVRATGTFLFELIAKASSHVTNQGRSNYV
jgi:pimeloyl-ACP methyl ester carboxylesterase